MEINDLPLRALFYKLRSAGLVLGIDEYQLLLQALMAGFGLTDRAALGRLCKTLWAKSLAEQRIFDQYFNQFIDQEITRAIVTFKPPVAPQLPDPKPISGLDSEPVPLDAADRGSLLDLPPSQPLEDGEGILPPGTVSDIPPMMSMAETTVETQDVVQTTKTSKSLSSELGDYVFSNDYLPLTARQAKQSWRYLRRPVRAGALTELDVAATIQQIAQEGFFYNPVLIPQKVDRSQLILLLDMDGSMVAFHSLGERLKETAIAGERLGRSQVYYFHNCPVDYLYSDPGQCDYQTIEQVLDQASPIHTSVLIFSDAGAARGGYSQDRLEWTQLFLQKFQQKIRYLAWINPVPRELPQDRWADTTAGEIAKLIPMFEADRAGLQKAIKVLQGNLIRN